MERAKKEDFEKVTHILFHEYSWNSKEMDEGSFKIQDVIEATKQILQSQQPKRKQDCTCSLRDMAEDDPTISCEQCEQPKQEFAYDDQGNCKTCDQNNGAMKQEEEKECDHPKEELHYFTPSKIYCAKCEDFI